VAENCLLAQPIERLLWRKLPLKLAGPAAIYDPYQSLIVSSLTVDKCLEDKVRRLGLIDRILKTEI